MKTRESADTGKLSPQPEAETFRMLAIYDSPESCEEAARASGVILRELGEDFAVHKSSWALASLKNESTRRQAAEEATCADVILVALAKRELSTAFRDWISEWQRKREVAGGLLALIPSGEAKTAAEIAEYLYETAVSANMDFLCRKKRRF